MLTEKWIHEYWSNVPTSSEAVLGLLDNLKKSHIDDVHKLDNNTEQL